MRKSLERLDFVVSEARTGKEAMEHLAKSQPDLVCLDLTEPDRQKPRELWHVHASAGDKSLAFFEGSPLVHDGRVYIALSKFVGRRVLTSIVCYDLLGRRRWSREVCDSPEFEENPDRPRYRQHLLTWAGGQIVYCSHAGAIVAVDAWTGQPTWGVRYPSRGPLTSEFEPSPRDLTPGLYVDGRVFAAPLDTDRLFCLDAVTGTLRWELEGVEIVHLLSASHRQLVTEPLRLTDTEVTYDIDATIEGGGVAGQAGALRLGIARSLIEIDENLRGALKKAGLLTRDSRAKETKKYGLKKARKAPQYSKR